LGVVAAVRGGAVCVLDSCAEGSTALAMTFSQLSAGKAEYRALDDDNPEAVSLLIFEVGLEPDRL
jgi:hypothetical protein